VLFKHFNFDIAEIKRNKVEVGILFTAVNIFIIF